MQTADFELITRIDQWEEVLAQLDGEPRLALDLEANSMFAYREQICLIQISIPTQDFILDPLADFELEPLGDILADERVEKIFHAAEYDLILIKRQFGWELNNLFDTMWAARILGYPRYGLANLLKDFYGVQLNKRFQKSDWCRRPLKPDQLAYAALDTHYLFDLRDRLAHELADEGRLEEAAEIFDEQTAVIPGDNGFDPDSFWSIHGARDLPRSNQAILKAAHIFRDQEARRRDQPLFKIFPDRTLVELAELAPRNTDELSRVHGMSRGQMRRYGNQLLDLVERARQEKPPSYPRRSKRLPEEVIERYEVLHTWRKNRARTRGVESDVIISRDALWELAQKNPQEFGQLAELEHVGAWRCKAYGEDLLRVLHDGGV